VWGSTYPYNPYPFPWVNHLFQDAPSIAIGVFEGHMRKMADGFAAIRRARKVLDGEYDPAGDEEFFRKFDWRQFDDDEFALCPPIFAVGGDGAMLDIGFQNLSRLLASGKPIRVMMLDTQVYSNTGGQACTSGFTGQVSDMAEYGPAQRGKEETRKEMALMVIAHRGAYLLQSSQAAPSHFMSGVLKGLNTRNPSVFVLHCPCPPEHGIADDAAAHQAKLALESRAFSLIQYDPEAGPSLSDRLTLDGNPSPDETWPTYELTYLDDDGAEQSLELPLTIADWAATEARFKKHFKRLPADEADDLVPFHEFLEMPDDERAMHTPFIQALKGDRKLTRMSVSREIVELADDRLSFWHLLRHMAGEEVPPAAEALLRGTLESEFDVQMTALREEYEAKLAELKASYPQMIARKLAEGLLRSGSSERTIAEAMAEAASIPEGALANVALAPAPAATPAATTLPMAGTPAAAAPAEAAPAVADEEDEDDFALEAYIDSLRCTACNECTNLNNKLFAYNDKKQAFIKDAKAGTFKQLVMAAERCPVTIIHPGTPLNAKEPDLDKWVKRAARFN
jgi:pyruvate-ferredoxin/flavodoxin oxidoreductase